MNKKLIAVAVAGLFAAPAAALAQSSVTISGFFKGSLDYQKVLNVNAGRTGNTAETRITDHSSRMLFNVVEDLGGGMQAIGQYDLRFQIDGAQRISSVDGSGGTNTTSTGAAVGAGATFGNTRPTANPVSSGNSHVGLRTKEWGTLKLGRQDTHYGNTGDEIPGKGALWLHNSVLFDGVMRPGATVNTIAGWTRTPNLLWWDSPKWGGFTVLLGYSTNPMVVSGAQSGENDLGTNARKGKGWTLNPVYTGSNWEVAWSHWNAKSDWIGGVPSIAAFTEATTQGVNDEKADSLRGHYIWQGLKIGLAWNQSKVSNPWSGNVVGNRRAWSVPVRYNTGAHTFYGTYTKAADSRDVAAAAAVVSGTTTVAAAQPFVSGTNTGANLLTLAYAYDLSKRTSVSLSYARLNNKAAGRYGLFYVGENVMGGTNSGSLAGEDHVMWGMTLRHGF